MTSDAYDVNHKGLVAQRIAQRRQGVPITIATEEKTTHDTTATH
jgi:hypothetical protein